MAVKSVALIHRWGAHAHTLGKVATVENYKFITIG
jgi:hypothetical protein